MVDAGCLRKPNSAAFGGIDVFGDYVRDSGFVGICGFDSEGEGSSARAALGKIGAVGGSVKRGRIEHVLDRVRCMCLQVRLTLGRSKVLPLGKDHPCNGVSRSKQDV